MEPTERARAMRWLAETKSKVTHPVYGSVIVPHLSNLAATENAAEFWGVDVWSITKETKVEWVPDDAGPVRRPREFFEKEQQG